MSLDRHDYATLVGESSRAELSGHHPDYVTD